MGEEPLGIDLCAWQRLLTGYALDSRYKHRRGGRPVPGPIEGQARRRRRALGGAGFAERTEARIEQRRCGRVQDKDLDLPPWTVGLEEIDRAVARRPGITASSRPPCRRTAIVPQRRRPWPWSSPAGKADANGRRIGEHYGAGSGAVSTMHRKVANGWQGVLPVVDALASRLPRKRSRNN
jgi:hypothetical protein